MGKSCDKTTFDQTLEQYKARFKKPPLMVYGVTTETLCELMVEALEQGRPIPDKDYYRHLPPGATA